jgi:hypothetical protein
LNGTDFLSGKKLTSEERDLSALGLMVGSGRGYRKGTDGLSDLVQRAGRDGVIPDGAVEGARNAIRQAERIAGKYQNYTNPKYAKQLENQLAEHGANSIKRSLRSLEKKLNEHLNKLPDLEYKSFVEKEIRAFQGQIDTIKEFMKVNGMK